MTQIGVSFLSPQRCLPALFTKAFNESFEGKGNNADNHDQRWYRSLLQGFAQLITRAGLLLHNVFFGSRQFANANHLRFIQLNRMKKV